MAPVGSRFQPNFPVIGSVKYFVLDYEIAERDKCSLYLGGGDRGGVVVLEWCEGNGKAYREHDRILMLMLLRFLLQTVLGCLDHIHKTRGVECCVSVYLHLLLCSPSGMDILRSFCHRP